MSGVLLPPGCRPLQQDASASNEATPGHGRPVPAAQEAKGPCRCRVGAGWRVVARGTPQSQKGQKSRGKTRCVLPPRLHVVTTHNAVALQASMPRFMYVNSEIVKRKDAIHIDVSPVSGRPRPAIIDSARTCVISSSTSSQTRRPQTGSRSTCVFFLNPPQIPTVFQNARSVQKVVTLLIPGILPDSLALPPPPTSATANPNIPVAIPLPAESKTPFPFIASTFSHACPTRAPGDQTRMYSVLGTFFQGPVSGEEKKRRIEARIACMRVLTHSVPPDTPPLQQNALSTRNRRYICFLCNK